MRAGWVPCSSMRVQCLVLYLVCFCGTWLLVWIGGSTHCSSVGVRGMVVPVLPIAAALPPLAAAGFTCSHSQGCKVWGVHTTTNNVGGCDTGPGGFRITECYPYPSVVRCTSRHFTCGAVAWAANGTLSA